MVRSPSAPVPPGLTYATTNNTTAATTDATANANVP